MSSRDGCRDDAFKWWLFCQLIYKNRRARTRNNILGKHPLPHDSLVQISHSFFSVPCVPIGPRCLECGRVLTGSMSHSTPCRFAVDAYTTTKELLHPVAVASKHTNNPRTHSQSNSNNTTTRHDTRNKKWSKTETKRRKNIHKQVNWNCVLCDLLNTVQFSCDSILFAS